MVFPDKLMGMNRYMYVEGNPDALFVYGVVTLGYSIYQCAMTANRL